MLITVPGASNTSVTVSATNGDSSRLAAQIGALLATIQGAGNLAVQTVSLPGGQSSVGVGTAGDITRLCRGILNRAAAPAELQYWTNLVNNSALTLANLANDFIGSPKYTRNFGLLSNAAFVNQIYENMFSRPADAADSQFWVSQLAAGADRGAVAVAIAESAEAKTGFDVTPGNNNNAEIYRIYQTAFGHAPDPAVESFVTGMMKSGATVQQVVAAIAQSPEFQAEGADGPAAFVTAMYDNALDHAPRPNDLAYWVSQIAAGLPLSNVVIDLADSAESKALRAGPTTELVLAGPGGINMSVPTTYNYVVDNDATADTLTASNAAIVTNTVGDTFFLSGNSTLAAAGGDSTVNATGSYDVSFGTGHNLINASGSGIITTGISGGPSGASTVIASSFSGPGNVINLSGDGDVVSAAFGSATVNAFAAATNATISGGFGALSVNVDNLSGGNVVLGGTGPLTFAGGGSGATVFGGSGGSTVTTGNGLVFYAGGATNAVLGTGASTIFGGGNSDVTFGSGSVTGPLTYFATSGNVTLNASAATGNVTASLAGSASISTGAGNDSIYVGSGPEILNAGGGFNQYYFLSGEVGGVVTINDSLANIANDTFNFHGYSANLGTTTHTITLSDNTTLDFTNVTVAQAIAHFNTG